jgi:YgiT-type zinc finger domain-containing protein
MRQIVTDLPFKVSETTIVVIKVLPVLQCDNCSEYLIEDAVMAAVERILASRDDAAELEVVRYAA